jgi:hypothetical protein
VFDLVWFGVVDIWFGLVWFGAGLLLDWWARGAGR